MEHNFKINYFLFVALFEKAIIFLHFISKLFHHFFLLFHQCMTFEYENILNNLKLFHDTNKKRTKW